QFFRASRKYYAVPQLGGSGMKFVTDLAVLQSYQAYQEVFKGRHSQPWGPDPN
ncbi:Hypothetical protein FKW44_017290, partial [Caligus rogercresseyi]